jgi:hypothetical protein
MRPGATHAPPEARHASACLTSATDESGAEAILGGVTGIPQLKRLLGM